MAMAPCYLNLLPAVVLTILGTILPPVHGLQCKFKLAAYTYDLCPLFIATEPLVSDAASTSRNFHLHADVSTPPTTTRKTYDIDIGGEGLQKDTTLPATEQCPEGTWICFRISNTRPSHPSEPRRVTQIIPVAGNIKEDFSDNESSADHAEVPQMKGVNATARLIFPEEDNNNAIPILAITLNGGWYLSRPHHAVISFHCNTSASEPSEPISEILKLDSVFPSAYFEGHIGTPDTARSYTHDFTWNTKHACPIARDLPESPSETPPEGGEEDNTEVPLSDDEITRSVDKVRTGGIIVGSIMVVALLSYGIYITHVERRKRSYVSFSEGHPSPSPALFQSFRIPALPSVPFSLPTFLRPARTSRRLAYFGSRLRSDYEPLTAEEYEILDEDENQVVVNFQRQGLVQGLKTGSAGQSGYGSVR